MTPESQYSANYSAQHASSFNVAAAADVDALHNAQANVQHVQSSKETLQSRKQSHITLHVNDVINRTVRKTQCLVDTGAEVSIISNATSTALHSIALNALQRDDVQSLRMADGTTVVPTSGVKHLWLWFNDVMLNHKFVVADIEQPAISLGSDFMGKFESAISIQHHAISAISRTCTHHGANVRRSIRDISTGIHCRGQVHRDCTNATASAGQSRCADRRHHPHAKHGYSTTMRVCTSVPGHATVHSNLQPAYSHAVGAYATHCQAVGMARSLNRIQ